MMWYQQGEPAAAPALVELLSPQLYRFLTSQMGSRADAEGNAAGHVAAHSPGASHLPPGRTRAPLDVRHREPCTRRQLSTKVTSHRIARDWS